MRNNPAFPMQSDDARNAHPDWQGLTKREYIATEMMAAVLVHDRGLSEETLAHWAARAADALIAELSK